MPNQSENENTGIRWLSIFEGSMTMLVVSAVLGIFAVFNSTQSLQHSVGSMADKIDAMSDRLSTSEKRNESRFNAIEIDVHKLQLDMTKVKATHEIK